MQIQDEHAQRLSASLASLSERMARLAIGLGVRLDDQQAVQELMDQPQMPPVENDRRTSSANGEMEFSAPSTDRRQAHLREELRGLLVLRYHLQTDILTDTGLTLARQIVAQAQERLIRKGFKPGADGLDLDHFLQKSMAI